MSKDEFLEIVEDQREKLLDALDSLDEELMQTPGVVGDWSVKDVLSHLIAWESELVRLLWQLRQGEKPTTVHFSQVSVDDQNKKIYFDMRERSLDQVLNDLPAVRKQTIRRVEAFSENELAEPDRFAWLGNRPLWEWVAADSFEHEAEHTTQILSWRDRIITG